VDGDGEDSCCAGGVVWMRRVDEDCLTNVECLWNCFGCVVEEFEFEATVADEVKGWA